MGPEVLAGLEEFPLKKPPRAFFRFYDKKGLRALTHGTLKFSPPKLLNDPFEMWAGLNLEEIDQDSLLRSLIISTGIFQHMVRYKIGNSPIAYEQAMSRIIRAAHAHPEKGPAHLRSMNDAIYNVVADNIGICSLSAFAAPHLAGPIGIRHWAMYADNHRGFAIEYSGRFSLFAGLAKAKWLFPVDYRRKRLRSALSDFDVWNDAQLTRTLRLWTSVKCSAAWGHEKEWRIVAPLIASKRLPQFISEKTRYGNRLVLKLWSGRGSAHQRSLDAQIIRRVILGARASDKLEAQIRATLARPHYSHVILERAACCEQDYAMVYKPG